MATNPCTEALARLSSSDICSSLSFPSPKIGLELVADEGRKLASFHLYVGEELRPVRLHCLIEQRRLWLPTLVHGRAASCRSTAGGYRYAIALVASAIALAASWRRRDAKRTAFPGAFTVAG